MPRRPRRPPQGGGGEDLDQYIDGLLNSDAPAVPGTQQEETGPTPPQTPDQQPGKATPDPSHGDGTAEASAAAAAAVAAAAPALARNVETCEPFGLPKPSGTEKKRQMTKK